MPDRTCELCGNHFVATTGRGTGNRGRPQAYCGKDCSRLAARIMGLGPELRRWVEDVGPTSERRKRVANMLRTRVREMLSVDLD